MTKSRQILKRGTRFSFFSAQHFSGARALVSMCIPLNCTVLSSVGSHGPKSRTVRTVHIKKVLSLQVLDPNGKIEASSCGRKGLTCQSERERRVKCAGVVLGTS